VSLLDWGVFFAFLVWVITDGVRRHRRDADAEAHLLAGRAAPWWVMGLSIMATQASAITMLSTTGLGYSEGLRFAQFYLGVPLAMLILAFTLVPLYHRARVFTAYEYLGQRFDERTRLLSASVFLILRGLSVGIVIQAPSAILSLVLGIETTTTIITMGVIAVLYTAVGGMSAVLSTDVKQMAVMVLGLVITFIIAVARLPEGVGLGGALHLAELTDRLDWLDLSFDPGERYTLWSALLGGTLLFLAYFGCDQSQAQRYLAGRSLGDERGALLLNGLAKFPFQLFILLTGVLVFAVHNFEPPPVSFVPGHQRALEVGVGASPAEGSAAREAVDAAIEDAQRRWEERRRAALAAVLAPGDAGAGRGYREADAAVLRSHAAAVATLTQWTGEDTREQRFIFPHFILNALPMGLVGLLIAAIFAAALSSIDSELNAMATVAVMDLHPRGRAREWTPAGVRRASSVAMVAFGALATGFALAARRTASLVEQVNAIGSYFYGALLGTFVLAVGVRRVGGVGACTAIVAGIAAVWLSELLLGEALAFLYRNTVGTFSAVAAGILASLLTGEWRRRGIAGAEGEAGDGSTTGRSHLGDAGQTAPPRE